MLLFSHLEKNIFEDQISLSEHVVENAYILLIQIISICDRELW
jgi:hypothetical protein